LISLQQQDRLTGTGALDRLARHKNPENALNS
jgi:hypothetical protein